MSFSAPQIAVAEFLADRFAILSAKEFNDDPASAQKKTDIFGIPDIAGVATELKKTPGQVADDLLSIRTVNSQRLHGEPTHERALGRTGFSLYGHHIVEQERIVAFLKGLTGDQTTAIKEMTGVAPDKISHDLAVFLSLTETMEAFMKIYEKRKTEHEATTDTGIEMVVGVGMTMGAKKMPTLEARQIMYLVELQKLEKANAAEADDTKKVAYPQKIALLTALFVEDIIYRTTHGSSEETGSVEGFANRAIVDCPIKRGGFLLFGDPSVLGHQGSLAKHAPELHGFKGKIKTPELLALLGAKEEARKGSALVDDVARQAFQGHELQNPLNIEAMTLFVNRVVHANLAYYAAEKLSGGKRSIDIIGEVSDHVRKLMASTFKDEMKRKAADREKEAKLKGRKRREAVALPAQAGAMAFLKRAFGPFAGAVGGAIVGTGIARAFGLGDHHSGGGDSGGSGTEHKSPDHDAGGGHGHA